MARKQQIATPKTVAELRAQIAEGSRKAASVYRQAAAEDLPGADAWAARLDQTAARNDALAADALRNGR